jgi:hypothetical protein
MKIKLLCKAENNVYERPFKVGEWYEFVTTQETVLNCVRYHNERFLIALYDDLSAYGRYIWNCFYTQQEIREQKLTEVLNENI